MKLNINIEKSFILIVILISILFMIIIQSFNSSIERFGNPTAVNGQLDLTNWNFNHNGIVRLDGSWNIYWDKLLTPKDFSSTKTSSEQFSVPGIWNNKMMNGKIVSENGFMTLRLKVLLTDTSELKCIYIPIISSSYKLWINNNLISSSGIVGTSKFTMKPAFSTNYIDFQCNQKSLDIVLQVSNYNYYYGGINYSILLGNYSQLKKLQLQHLALDLTCFICAFLIGVYSFVIYIIRKKNISALYFSIFSMLMSLRPLLYGDSVLLSIFPNINFEILCDIYLSILLATQFILLFIYSLYPEEASKNIVKLLGFIQVFLVAFKILTNAKTLKYLITIYDIIIIIVCLYIFYIIILAMYKKRKNALLIFSGILILLLFAFNDILYNLKFINSGYYAPVGFVIFIFAQSFVLCVNLSDSFNSTEELSLKLISLDKLKDEFLSNTSHELRTPLNGIIGLAQSMIDGVSGSLNETQILNLSMIITSGKRLNSLISDILDFSRLKNSDIILQKKPVDIKSVVEIVHYILNPLYAEKPVIIKNTISNNLPLVYGDENRLQQIMYNLIGNALKFTEKGTVEISAVERNNFIEISITDTGIGISDEILPHIFNSFEQGDSSISRRYGGTGLGLSISKNLILLHGGDISVTSKLGEGSTFIVKLPVYKGFISKLPVNKSSVTSSLTEKTLNFNIFEEKKTAKSQNFYLNSEKKQDKNSFKILIVDDEPINVQVISNILKLEGYIIDTASNGLDALSKIKGTEKPDLILLDLMLPKMSGFEVCSKIREIFSLHELPVLMVTSKNSTADILAAFNVGANDYISKPFENSELKARIKTLLELKSKVRYALTAEICFLQSQIKPHFIFNTLNSIISFCRTDPEKARELLINFSSYLRRSFDFKDLENPITLEKELDLVKAYLAIEQARFPQKLKIEYKLISDLNITVPPLILQPIVENAIRHGLMNKPSMGTVTISSELKGKQAVFKITDDGIGIPKEKIPLLLDGKLSNVGIGINNINRRLKSIYGYGLIIESEINEGTTVYIKIPYPI